ncbi:Pvc16 family protein [Jatrophihabitans telluris]|uniref:Pvc16 family protein n=1 Tax=Jatrophihabitans telluris TaxID=2038343 RepID=A0ABY4QY77_9ACTN|nr:DUF4255 domain-containing protein [Jatrophihabitans telluris]UQX88107.1 Pvc16 family protein [Jatrophihabitans telluris]
MSDARAIEAVTETLRNLIDVGVKDVEAGAVAIARPPDRVADTNFDLQVNLFLYQTLLDPTLRNEPPVDAGAGESGEPALPLVLRYLVTAISRDGDDLGAHRMLGGALSALHDHPVLSRADLAAAAPYSNVSQQIDRVRITWQSLEEKDIYSLWSVFQTPYRLSASFEARVVLIDSAQPGHTPLPVLRRGAQDQGPQARADTSSGLALIAAASPPNGKPAAVLGDAVTLLGANLGGNLAPNTPTVRLRHPMLSAPVDVTGAGIVAATDNAITFTVPDQPAAVPAGSWLVSVLPPAHAAPVASVPLLIGPQITSPLPVTIAAAPPRATVTLTCSPQVRRGQSVLLLLGDRAFAAEPVTVTTSTVSFRIDALAAGEYRMRLRVDGVDSPLVDLSSHPPVFDPAYLMTVT